MSREYGSEKDKEYRGSFENVDLEDGKPPQRSSNDPNSNSPNRLSDYFNYYPPMLILASSVFIWIVLLLVCFLSPNGGLNAIFKDGGDYVGVLRKCSASSCDPWMAASASGGSSSGSSSSSSSSSSASEFMDSVGEKAASLGSSSSFSSANKRMIKRAADAADLSNFYLTTGLACLACFWLMTYTLIFIIIRYFSSSLPTNEVTSYTPYKESPSLRKYLAQRSKAFKNPLKKFAHRTSRIFLFFLSLTMFGVALDASVKVLNVTGASGIGMGVILLHACWIILFLITYFELTRGEMRRRADLTFWGCKCFQFCPKYNTRARRKWEDYDAQRGGRGKPEEKAKRKEKNRERKVNKDDEDDLREYNDERSGFS